MAQLPSLLIDSVASALGALSDVSTSVADFRDLDEQAFLRVNRMIARSQQLSAALGAFVAGEVAHRSAAHLGSSGLAQKSGFRTPEEFVKASTGASGRDASTAVRVGRIAHDSVFGGEPDPLTGELAAESDPWMRKAVGALAAGALSVAAFDSIRGGVGRPNSFISVDQLATVVERLLSDAGQPDPNGRFSTDGRLDADALARRARQLRDDLDQQGVALRADELWQQRSLRLFSTPDGMGKLIWSLDPETFALVKTLHDRAVSPKLGGVRFGDPVAEKQAEGILADTRTVAQLGSDEFAHLLAAGADADSSHLLSSGGPVVRILTTAAVAESGTGRGAFEGFPGSVPAATIDRALCAGASQPILLTETGDPLDVGREQRLFTAKQKVMLAVLFGGCMWGNCDRPPSYCEAHHVNHWQRDSGKTDIRNGILLCRHHHLLLHNNGWEIRRDDPGRFWLIPPKDIDTAQVPLLMRSKSAALSQYLTEQTG
jgi:hypothetical protein